MVFQWKTFFIGSEQGLYKLQGVGRGFGGEYTVLTGAGVLGMLHVREEFQVLKSLLWS